MRKPLNDLKSWTYLKVFMIVTLTKCQLPLKWKPLFILEIVSHLGNEAGHCFHVGTYLIQKLNI